MNIKIIALFLFIGFIYINSAASPKIIIKLDDLSALNGTLSGRTAMDYLIQKKVKFSYGVIANRLDNTSLSTLSSYLNAIDTDGDHLFEVWNHGLEHTCTEFSTSYPNQKSHFDQATQLVKKYLGIQMHSFGSPCNTNDSVTVRVLSEDKNYKVFMLSNVTPDASKKILALNWPRVEFENGVGNPQYDFFLKNYNSSIIYSPKYMILQGHPNGWTTSQLEQFKLIIDFLLVQGCEFVLPYEYYISLKAKTQPVLHSEMISTKQVKLDWTDRDSLRINFKIERSEDSIKWINLGTSPENLDNTYIDNNIVTKSGRCYYRIQPNIGIKTVYSNVVGVTNLNTDTIELPILNDLSFTVFPNPCGSEITIKLTMTKPDDVTCDIYNLTGEFEKSLFSDHVLMGNSQYSINTSGLKSGIYFCRLRTSSNVLLRKLIINNN